MTGPSRQRERDVQRAWGRNDVGTFEERPLCWSRVGEGKSRGGEHREVMGQTAIEMKPLPD